MEYISVRNTPSLFIKICKKGVRMKEMALDSVSNLVVYSGLIGDKKDDLVTITL